MLAKESVRNSLLFVLSLLLLNCNAQPGNSIFTKNDSRKTDKVVGGPFENGEFMYMGMPQNIHPADTSPGWVQRGQKLLITGTMYEKDGKTPAPGVILYYYHTDITGHYTGRKNLDKRVLRHGYIRGWVKSDKNGRYAIYTVRPAPYPNDTMPAHIHPAIKEPGINKEYYIDEFVFDDDRLLSGTRRKTMENRGGSGILRLLVKDSLQIAEHDIILGLNIPNYPRQTATAIQSGLAIGVDQPSFRPFHAYGPDKGTRTCPVCKYGRYQGILYFAGNNANWMNIKKWLTFLDEESRTRNKYLKAYLIYEGNNAGNSEQVRQELMKIGAELRLEQPALTFVPSFQDKESEVYLNKINAAAENTFILYRNGSIIARFIDLLPTAENFRMLSRRLDQTRGNYLDLPALLHN